MLSNCMFKKNHLNKESKVQCKMYFPQKNVKHLKEVRLYVSRTKSLNLLRSRFLGLSLPRLPSCLPMGPVSQLFLLGYLLTYQAVGWTRHSRQSCARLLALLEIHQWDCVYDLMKNMNKTVLAWWDMRWDKAVNIQYHFSIIEAFSFKQGWFCHLTNFPLTVTEQHFPEELLTLMLPTPSSCE